MNRGSSRSYTLNHDFDYAPCNPVLPVVAPVGLNQCQNMSELFTENTVYCQGKIQNGKSSNPCTSYSSSVPTILSVKRLTSDHIYRYKDVNNATNYSTSNVTSNTTSNTTCNHICNATTDTTTSNTGILCYINTSNASRYRRSYATLHHCSHPTIHLTNSHTQYHTTQHNKTPSICPNDNEPPNYHSIKFTDNAKPTNHDYSMRNPSKSLVKNPTTHHDNDPNRFSGTESACKYQGPSQLQICSPPISNSPVSNMSGTDYSSIHPSSSSTVDLPSPASTTTSNYFRYPTPTSSSSASTTYQVLPGKMKKK